jgi:hypothetical protein
MSLIALLEKPRSEADCSLFVSGLALEQVIFLHVELQGSSRKQYPLREALENRIRATPDSEVKRAREHVFRLFYEVAPHVSRQPHVTAAPEGLDAFDAAEAENNGQTCHGPYGCRKA